MLPPLLGKTFFAKRRLPVAVDLTKKDLRTELEKATCGALYRYARAGLTHTVPACCVHGIIQWPVVPTDRAWHRACSTALYRHATGTSNSVQLGTTSQPPKQLVANIVAGVEQVVERIPGKWANIQSLQLRTTNSVALPFYNAL